MITFRKFYSEPEEGEAPSSIVAYRERVCAYDGDYNTVVKTLWVDFLFFTVKFNWVKEVEPQRTYGHKPQRGLIQ